MEKVDLSREKALILFFTSFFLFISLILRDDILSFAGASKGEEIYLESKNGFLFLREGQAALSAERGETSILPEHAPLLFQKININTATYELLNTIPGIGPKTANLIVEMRDQKGGFDTAEELLEIKGIGVKRLEKLKKHLTFQVKSQEL